MGEEAKERSSRSRSERKVWDDEAVIDKPEGIPVANRMSTARDR